MSKKTKTLIIIVGLLLFSIVSSFLIYFNIYYHAVDVDTYLKTDNSVSVVVDDDYYFFDGSGTNKALILYPGAKVEAKSYAPLCKKMASSGVDVFLMKMPLRFAMFDMDAADNVIEKYKYENLYIGGHSLGGVVASMYAKQNQRIIKGIVLLGSYSTIDFSNTNMKCISIYGDMDKVVNRDNIKKGKNKFKTENYIEYVMEGANHANFGSYGNQKGDGKASISKEKQWDDTANIICLNL